MENLKHMKKKEIYHSAVENLDYCNRTLCSTLEDMRQIVLNLSNKDTLLSLINEAQVYANRMEAKLNDVREYKYMKKQYKEMQKEVKKNKKKRPVRVVNLDD